MIELIILIIVVMVILAIIKSIKNKEKDVEERYPYKKKEKLFTPTEMKFYNELKEVVKGKYTIFGQVRMEDLINVEKGIERKKANGLRARIRCRHLDFVLCEPNSSNIIAAIELDDKTHRSKKAIKTDAFKNKAFKDAGLTLIRFKVGKTYKELIETKLLENIGFKSNQHELELKTESEKCNKCSSKMIYKKANRGKHAGKTFLACSNYPKCKNISPID